MILRFLMGTSIDYMQKEVEKTVRKMVKEEQKNPKHVPREKTDQNCGWLAGGCMHIELAKSLQNSQSIVAD